MPTEADNLDRLPGQHRRTASSRSASVLPRPPVAISFAFPGPADYPAGIIGDLANLPAFRGGVALGPMSKRSSACRCSSTTTATCSSTARPSPASCRRSTSCWNRPAVPSVTGTCSASRWVPVLGRHRPRRPTVRGRQLGRRRGLALAQQVRSGHQCRGRGLHPRRPPRLCAPGGESPPTTRPSPR